jgi:hypothetical protein
MTGAERSVLVRRMAVVAGPLVAAIVLLLVARQLTADWRRLPPEAGAEFHLSLADLIAAWCAQTVGWLLAVDTWRSILARLGGRLRFAHHMQLYAYSSLAQPVKVDRLDSGWGYLSNAISERAVVTDVKGAPPGSGGVIQDAECELRLA